MKKAILLFFLTSFLITKSNAQGIYSDINFLKANLQMLSACSTLSDIYSSGDQEAEGQKNLPILKINVDATAKYYKLVKAKFATDKEFKTFETNVQGLKKCYEMLDNYKPEWALLYTLIKMNVVEIVNTKLK